MEASSCRHDQSLTQAPSSSPSQRMKVWIRKLHVSDYGLVLLVTNIPRSYSRVHPEWLLENKKTFLSPKKFQGTLSGVRIRDWKLQYSPKCSEHLRNYKAVRSCVPGTRGRDLEMDFWRFFSCRFCGTWHPHWSDSHPKCQFSRSPGDTLDSIALTTTWQV